MTSIMLACYPEIFAAGAIVAGLPYGAATNVQQAFESMRQSSSRSPREWGNLVRRASPYGGRWPRVSVWHGDADNTVVPSNALAVLKQWTDVHGLALAPSVKSRVDGYLREVWLGEAGDELIEAYTISNMAHGTPLAIDQREGACGAPGPFLLPVGISSSYHIAKFFGLAHRDVAYQTSKAAPSSDRSPENVSLLEGEISMANAPLPLQPRGVRSPWVDIGETINNAFRAAGLIKD